MENPITHPRQLTRNQYKKQKHDKTVMKKDPAFTFERQRPAWTFSTILQPKNHEHHYFWSKLEHRNISSEYAFSLLGSHSHRKPAQLRNRSRLVVFQSVKMGYVEMFVITAILQKTSPKVEFRKASTLEKLLQFPDLHDDCIKTLILAKLSRHPLNSWDLYKLSKCERTSRRTGC